MALISVTCLLTFVFENSRSPACPVCCNLTQEGSHGNLHFRSAELASGKITPLDVLATTWAEERVNLVWLALLRFTSKRSP